MPTEKRTAQKQECQKEEDVTNDWLESSLNNNQLVRELFWTKTKFQLILFRDQYSFLHPLTEDGRKTQWKKDIEIEEKGIEDWIEEAEKSGLFKTVDLGRKERIYVFNIEETGYPPIDLLKLIQRFDYPVPGGLIEAIEGNTFEKAAELLTVLHDNIIYKLTEFPSIFTGRMNR